MSVQVGGRKEGPSQNLRYLHPFKVVTEKFAP
jgi:hypothetical protein